MQIIRISAACHPERSEGARDPPFDIARPLALGAFSERAARDEHSALNETGFTLGQPLRNRAPSSLPELKTRFLLSARTKTRWTIPRPGSAHARFGNHPAARHSKAHRPIAPG